MDEPTKHNKLKLRQGILFYDLWFLIIFYAERGGIQTSKSNFYRTKNQKYKI